MSLPFSQENEELDRLRGKTKSLARKELQIMDSIKKVDATRAELDSKRDALLEELSETRKKKLEVESELKAKQKFLLDAVVRVNSLMEQLESDSLLAPRKKEPQAATISTQTTEPTTSSDATKKAGSSHVLPYFSAHADLDAMASTHSPISDTSSDFWLAEEPMDAKPEPRSDFGDAVKYAGCMVYDFSQKHKYIGTSGSALVRHEHGRKKNWSEMRLKPIDLKQLRAYCAKAYETYEEGNFDCPLCFSMIAAGTRKDVFHHLVRHHAQKGRRYRLNCYPYKCPECRRILLELDEAKDHDIREHGICWAAVEDREAHWCLKNTSEKLEGLFEECLGWR